ncbi:MAG: hypothetical protein O2906_01970 [Bacteroidetes bacterium]|nr:hypothetical protein [Bacteroidota bacterium]MDA0859725.1 hypothetical protein [Bacteroidota bacterium]MDA1317689.1 hypothetical protein [Bacteroidota bacterium]
MARAMFKYTKMILKKVSFDTNLFCTEVKKAMERLLPYEIEELKVFIESLIKINPDLRRCSVYLV